MHLKSGAGLEIGMNDRQSFTRSAGILMAVSSLPSHYGIGSFGKEAYRFVDFVKQSGHKYWQVLPLGPVTYGDSPYQSFSAFAGNPYYIDLDTLAEEGLLTKSFLLSIDWGDGIVPVNISENEAAGFNFETADRDIKYGDSAYVSYEKIYKGKYKALKKAFEKFISEYSIMNNNGYTSLGDYFKEDNMYKNDNREWLDDYALFMAVKGKFDNANWSEWDDDIRTRTPEGICKYNEMLSSDIEYWKFLQFEFDRQWSRLKKYANDNRIEIIGDIPIYMGYDSVDVWADTGEYQLDEKLKPVNVAGVPPDAFSDLGQKWGNPLYDWDKMEQNNFSWWRRRMQRSAKLYDVIRIDHFIGIVKYYSIPADMPDARNGVYKEGPAGRLTNVINEAIGDKKIIAEDLGVSIYEVDKLLEENNYPGMKVLAFAFSGDRRNPHLPFNYKKNCVAYGGTHDNETLKGYFAEHPDYELVYAKQYLDEEEPDKMIDEAFRAAYSSVADIVIFSVQDILHLGNYARMNAPSTIGSNWKWRLLPGQLTQQHAEKLKYLVSIYGRE